MVFEYLGHKFGVLICEDIWSINTVKQLSQLNVDTVLVLNSSPYEVGKPQHRKQTLSELAKQLHLNIVYVNQVGGQDDLILMVQVLSAIKMVKLLLQAPSFKEDLYIAEFDRDTKLYKVVESAPALETLQRSIKV